MERETRFELATSTLARLHSTTELFPQNLEAAPRFELGVKDLQSSALPLGHAAGKKEKIGAGGGFEPAAPTLASWKSILVQPGYIYQNLKQMQVEIVRLSKIRAATVRP